MADRDRLGRFVSGSSGFARKHSESSKKKMSEAKSGKETWIKGKSKRDYPQLSNSGRKKGFIAWNKGLSGVNNNQGAKHPNWNGGTSFESYPADWKDSLKESIRSRDCYMCQMCGVHQDELDVSLHVHHIDYDKENLDPKNLVSLCVSCHAKTNYNREKWYNYFINKL